MTLISSQTFT